MLFPLLDRVKALSRAASNSRADSGDILIHHSRDTESKQWAETRVLTLNGVVKVFVMKRQVLLSLGMKSWKKMFFCTDAKKKKSKANTGGKTLPHSPLV